MSISTLLLDLDGTLYPFQNGIWDAIAARMEMYMQNKLKIAPAEISNTRMRYYQKYGTTLRGIQANYQVDPYEFLNYVHDIPIKEYLKPDRELDAMLQAAPQEKWIFTNSDRGHTERVLNALGIEKHFKGILDIIKMDFNNKPSPYVYQKALEYIGKTPADQCLFADDAEKNLVPAHNYGITTVLVGKTPAQSNRHYHIQTIHQLPEVLEKIKK